jgi:general secretion pathway protein E
VSATVHPLPATPPRFAELVERARREAAASGRRVVEALEEASGLAPEAFVQALGAELRYPVLSMRELDGYAPDFALLPYAEAAQHGCVALRGADGRLTLLFDDPFSVELAAWADARIPERFDWRLAHHGDLAAFLTHHEDSLSALDAMAQGAARGAPSSAEGEDLSLKAIGEDDSEVVRLVRSTLRDALKLGASDIHLECTATGLAIKFRVDGMLSQVKALNDPQQAEQAISRIKVLSELDITERRVPQDGRFRALDHGREVDFRVSIMPSIHGEDAVLRVLDKEALKSRVQVLSLENLGFAGTVLKTLRRLSNEPYGMLLVTGPTGSGKTTTLYAALSEINRGSDKIVTIEDPVEYQLAGVLQIPVNEKKGLTFAKGLRSILRHDPDKIMVGEIRDPETANIAVQSALTGHLVFTTVHANNVYDVIGRFMHMNVDLYNFVSALNGVLAQRLVRLACAECAQPVHPAAELLRDSGIAAEDAGAYRFRGGLGCRHCRGTGFQGRTAIPELLVLNDEMRELIAAREPIRRVKDAARRNGTRSLREAALDLVREGRTTLEEINRVTFVA